MKKLFYLSSCNTCMRIISEWQPAETVEMQDMKEFPLNEKDLEALKELAGSYEALFSKRARLFRDRGLHEQTLKEEDYKSLLLDHYTFLKRPVLVHDGSIFIGNSKKTVEAAKQSLHP